MKTKLLVTLTMLMATDYTNTSNYRNQTLTMAQFQQKIITDFKFYMQKHGISNKDVNINIVFSLLQTLLSTPNLQSTDANIAFYLAYTIAKNKSRLEPGSASSAHLKSFLNSLYAQIENILQPTNPLSAAQLDPAHAVMPAPKN